MVKQVGEAQRGETMDELGASREQPRRARRALAGPALAALAILGAAAPALAANPPPPPPPGYEVQPPPPGYYVQPGQPPPAYGPPGGYAPPGAYAQPGSYGMAAVGPKYLDWDEGDPIQPGYHPTTRIRRGLVIGGAVTFGSAYLLTAFSAAILVESHTDSSPWAPLFVPGLGPFITIGTAHASGGGTFVLVLDGLVQTGGIAMFVAGLVAPKTALVRNDIGKPRLAPVPMTFGRSSAGVGLVGTF